MSRVRKDERGFTLIELLVTMSVGMIVMAGILGLLDMTLRGSTTSLGRTHAVREGRGAIDRVGQELRLASCPDTGSAIISADGDTVSYYVARPLSNPQLAPVVERHTLTYTAANGTIALTVSPGTGTPPVWSGTPSRRAILGTGLSRTGTTPIFQYLSYDAPDASAMSLITAPVPAASLTTIAQVRVTFTALGAYPSAANGQLALPERRRTAHRRPLRRGQHARMLILRNLLQRLRREDGFTMMLVVGTMAVVVVVVGVRAVRRPGRLQARPQGRGPQGRVRRRRGRHRRLPGAPGVQPVLLGAVRRREQPLARPGRDEELRLDARVERAVRDRAAPDDRAHVLLDERRQQHGLERR